jgi:drug/metabolite transporter (DMT)-like permease
VRLSPLLLACLAATWLIWGSTYLAIKFALESFPPFYQMGSRFLVAGLLLIVWLKLRGRALPTLLEWRNAAIVGTLLLVGMGFTAYSEQTVASGVIVAYIAIIPIIVTAMNLPFGVKPTRLELVGMLVGVAGVLMLVQGAAFTASRAGLVAITVACVSWSLGSVLSQRRLQLAPGAMGFASEMLCGSIVLLVISAVVGERPAWPPTALAVGSWLYLIVFGSLIAFTAYMVLLSRVSAALAASYTFVNPVIALALGIWLAGERVSGFEWAAAAVITAGVVLVVVGRRPA